MAIEKIDEGDYRLACDYCGEWHDDPFDRFYDAVEFKKDRDNSWRSVRDHEGEWWDLCPACQSSEILRELKGVEDL
jgi:hypothetical protein